MLGRKIVLGAALALLAAGASPAAAQGFCDGPVGSGLCGAGIGGGLGAALGGRKGAQTGAILGGVIGLSSGLQQQQQYRQPVYAAPPPPRPTYRRAYVPAPPPAPAYDAQLVYSIQSGLLQLGYNPGPADGDYGPATASAIQQYESDNGLLVTGQATPQLYQHMQQYLN